MDLRILAAKIQQCRVHQRTRIDNAIRFLQIFSALDRDQLRIARACSHNMYHPFSLFSYFFQQVTM